MMVSNLQLTMIERERKVGVLSQMHHFLSLHTAYIIELGPTILASSLLYLFMPSNETIFIILTALTLS